MNDLYDNGMSKYLTSQDIYDALRELVQTEEMNILTEIGADVSWENQTYYYTDKGYKLKEQFDELSNFGDKMWLMDLAIMQMDNNQEIHYLVYDAITNTDLAKRIGFKKLFVEHMLCGSNTNYEEIIDAFALELGEFNCFDSRNMVEAFNKAIEENEVFLRDKPSYVKFCYCLGQKVDNLQLMKETQLIAKCRAHLTAYDDFIFGLRVNQALHNEQEKMYKQKIAKLEAAYKEKLNYLLMAANRAGLMPALTAELKNGNALPESINITPTAKEDGTA